MLSHVSHIAEDMSQKLSQLQLTDERSTQDSDAADRSLRSGSMSQSVPLASNTGEQATEQEDHTGSQDDDIIMSAGEEEDEDPVRLFVFMICIYKYFFYSGCIRI